MTIKKLTSIVLSLALSLTIFAAMLPTSAEEITLTDAEIQELVERSKLDTGDKYDDNIFTFEIVNLATLNDTLTAAYQTDLAAKSETYTNLTAAIEAMNTAGISVQLSIDGTQLTKDVSVSSFTSVMSEKDADLSLPYSVMREDVCVKRVCNSTNGHTYSNLKTGVVYTAEFTVDQNSKGVAETREYVGNFGIGFNEDYTLYCEATVIDVTELKATADAVFAKGIPAETLSKQITEISDNATVYLNVEAGKAKYYTFTATESGFVDTILYSTEATDAKITVKKISEGATVADITARPEYVSAGSRHSETVFNRFYANEGMTYAVIVEGTRDGGVAVMGLITTVSPRWYPQWMSESASGTMYWDSTNLDKASYYSTPVFVNYVPNQNSSHCLSSACYICAAALVLANMGKSTVANATDNVNYNKYDIRELPSTITATNYSNLTQKSLFADPYSVFLVRNSHSGKHYEYQSNGTLLASTSYDPSLSSSLITKAFGTTHSPEWTPISYSNTSSEAECYEELYEAIYDDVMANPEGILLRDQLGSSKHCIVVRNINGNLRVFDSGRSDDDSTVGRYYNVPLYTFFVTAKIRPIADYRSYTYYGE